jgi:hypothetical protein
MSIPKKYMCLYSQFTVDSLQQNNPVKLVILVESSYVFRVTCSGFFFLEGS